MAFPYLGLSFPNMGTKMRSRKWVRLTIVPPTEKAFVSSSFIPMQKARVTVMWGNMRPDTDHVANDAPGTVLGRRTLLQEDLGGVSAF